jgi:hypothetical protein
MRSAPRARSVKHVGPRLRRPEQGSGAPACDVCGSQAALVTAGVAKAAAERVALSAAATRLLRPRRRRRHRCWLRRCVWAKSRPTFFVMRSAFITIQYSGRPVFCRSSLDAPGVHASTVIHCIHNTKKSFPKLKGDSCPHGVGESGAGLPQRRGPSRLQRHAASRRPLSPNAGALSAAIRWGCTRVHRGPQCGSQWPRCSGSWHPKGSRVGCPCLRCPDWRSRLAEHALTLSRPAPPIRFDPH